MSTWPYGLGSSVRYAGILFVNAGALAMGGSKTLIDELIKR
jgi:hypothetical protein